MSPELHERMACVETRLDGIEKQQGEIASDVRVIRDHVIGANAQKRMWVKALALLGTGAGIAEAVKQVFFA